MQGIITKLEPPLWPHQRRALEFSIERGSALLAMRMATGKSRVAVDFIQTVGCKKVLIVCPKSVVPVWPEQIAKYGITIPKVHALKGTLKERETQFPHSDGVVIINYDAITSEKIRKAIYNWNPDCVIFDESHHLKAGRGSRRGKFALELGKRTKHKLLLTGTPAPHSPLDWYAQVSIVSPGFLGTRWDFELEYADQARVIFGTRKFMKTTGWKNLDALQERMKAWVFSVGEEVVELPSELPAVVRRFSLPKESLLLYREVREELVIDLRRHGVASVEALKAAVAKVSKMRQICSGFVISSELGKAVTLHNEKLDLLAEILEDLSSESHIVVFYTFKESARRITERLGSARKVFELSGRVPADSISGGVASWRVEGGILAAQLQSGSEGIDLTESAYCIYFELDDNGKNYDQSRYRIRRTTQARPCAYIYLQADKPASIEAFTHRALELKLDVMQSVMAAVRKPASEAG